MVAAAVTVGLHELHGELDKAHMALAYLLVVLFASARAGRVVGFTVSVACFLAFNFFLLPPYYTLAIDNPVDWLVLGSFLVTGAVAAELLHRARWEAELARRRAAELDRLATLGAETLSVARAEDAVAAIARVMRSEMGVQRCGVFMREKGRADVRLLASSEAIDDQNDDARSTGDEADPTARAGAVAGPEPGAAGAGRRKGGESELARLVTENGVVAFERLDGTSHLWPSAESLESALASSAEARVVLVPLRARERVVGLLSLEDSRGVRILPDQARMAAPLAYYAALGVERTRLAAEAEHAAVLREADRLKDALIATVSHDLRTPLTTIKALASDLRAGGDDRAATIEEEADRLNRLVADLLDLSRARSGALPLDLQLNAADDLVGAALQQLTATPGAERLRAHLPGDEILVGRFDFVHGLRSLVNLLENALRYSPSDTPVELTVARAGGNLIFAVEDRGPGIPQAERERIFEAFYRPSGLPDRPAGTGLGLTIARTLAEAQGGSVRYATRPDGGSRFELRLPAVLLDAALESPAG